MRLEKYLTLSKFFVQDHTFHFLHRFANLDSSAQKYTEKDLRPFCEQLERLLDNIHSMPDLNHLIYNYPR